MTWLQAFLSKEMMYSVALWSDEEGGVRGDLVAPLPASNFALENAQQRKLHHVCEALRLFPGARVLEFGSGWGGLAIHAAIHYGAEVDSLTLSNEQKREAESRVAELERKGILKSGMVRFHLRDYRECPAEFENAFDAFVSIEMIEVWTFLDYRSANDAHFYTKQHVGPRYYNKYFSIVDWALKPQRATAVVTSSTYPEHRFSGYQAEDFVRRYIWPNGTLPSASALIRAAESTTRESGRGGFTLVGVENHSKRKFHPPITNHPKLNLLAVYFSDSQTIPVHSANGHIVLSGTSPLRPLRLPSRVSALQGMLPQPSKQVPRLNLMSSNASGCTFLRTQALEWHMVTSQTICLPGFGETMDRVKSVTDSGGAYTVLSAIASVGLWLILFS